MEIKMRAGRTGGEIFCCQKNRNQEKAFRTLTFFEKTNLTIKGIMLFGKSYLDKCTLLRCSNLLGMMYGCTAVNWASHMRELFKEHFHRHTKNKILEREIEIDESLFGRREKYHKGNPNAGLKQNRSTEGCSKFKSPETRQAQERSVSTLEHMQVPKWDRTRCPEE